MTKKVVIPLGLKYDFAIRAYTSIHRGYLYMIREKFGAAAALEIYDMLCNREDRIKNFVNTVQEIFKIEGNDAEAIGKVYELWAELTGQEVTILERSKSTVRIKFTKCPFKTVYKDIGEWDLSFYNIAAKTINPKATVERLKGMCAGDPYCEFINKIED